MTRATAIVCLLPLLVAGLYAQETTQPGFEAASVKSGQTQKVMRADTYSGCSGGPGWTDPIRYACTAVPLGNLIETAWGLKSYQLTGPDSLDSSRYDIAAKVPAGATRDQFQQMLQKLLIDRLHLVVHHEMREQPVYVLSIGKDGHKLQVPSPGDTESPMDALYKSETGDGKKAGDDSPQQKAARKEQFLRKMEQIEIDAGRPTRTDLGPARMAWGRNNGVARFVGRRATMTHLTSALFSVLGSPVVDRTGLASEWNFIVEYGGAEVPAAIMATMQQRHQASSAGYSTEPSAPSGGQSIFTAFAAQPGAESRQRASRHARGGQVR